MYLNEQIPMVCLGCLENKYFPRDLINPVGWFSTKPSGRPCCVRENISTFKITRSKLHTVSTTCSTNVHLMKV